MAVTQNDIKFYKSAASGSAGGARTANEVTSALGNLFEAISDAERSAGGSKTKKWFLANISASESWSNPVVWIDTVPTNCTEQIGYGWDDSEDDDATQGNMVSWDQARRLRSRATARTRGRSRSSARTARPAWGPPRR